MVQWYYRSLFDDLEEIRNYMESLNHHLYGTNPIAMLPGHVISSMAMLPAEQDYLPVEITDEDDEIVVRAELPPEISKKDITLTLVNPHSLAISCGVTDELQNDEEGYFVRERRFRCISRIIAIPGPVTWNGSRASIKDGLLEVHLKKSEPGQNGDINIE